MKTLIKQIKEFKSENITQEFAAELSALLVWNHYRDNEYKSRGFTVKDAEPIGVLKNGGGSCSPWRESDSDRYIKTHNGVEITTCLNDTVRIFPDGNAFGRWRESDNAEYEYISRSRIDGTERKLYNPVGLSNQVKIVQLYIDHGFFSIEVSQ